MDDLISRQSVIEMLTEIETNNCFPTFAMLKQRVSDIPTAYNVDKVVEQLKDSSKTYCEEYHQRENNLYLLDAIEIVKAGDVKRESQ